MEPGPSDQQPYCKGRRHPWVASHKADTDSVDISVTAEQNSCFLPLRKNWLVLYETAAIETQQHSETNKRTKDIVMRDRIHLSPPEQHMTKGTVDRQTDSAFRIIWFTVAYKFNPKLPDIHV
jgi:hypothetical protein